jgi:hypothetical protein
MKRSTMFLVGAAGVTLAAWGADRSIHRPKYDRTPVAALPPECVRGPDGAMPALPQCQVPPPRSSSSSSSNSYNRSSYFGGGWGRSGSYTSPSTSTSSPGSSGPAVSRGGFGGSSSSFTSSGS